MAIYIVMLIGALNQVAFSGSRVATSLFALELGASPLAVGVLMAAYSLCPMLFSIIVGRYSDRMSPRKPMMVGAVATVLLLVLPFQFSQLSTLYVVALLLGLFHSIFNIPLEAVVGGIGGVDKRARNYAVITMGWSVANFLGPMVAGFSIDYLGHRAVFIVLAVFSALPIVLLWSLPHVLPGKAQHEGREKRGGVGDLWRMPALRTTIICGGVIGSARDLFQFFMPVYGHAIGLSASAIGTVLAMVALAAFVIRGSIPFLIRWLTEAQVLGYALAITGFAYVLLPFFEHPYVLGAIAFTMGLGVGSAEPIMLAMFYVLSPAGRIAEAVGLHKTIRNATQLAVPVIFGTVGSAVGYTAVFLTNAVMLAASSALTRKIRSTRTDLRARRELKTDKTA